MRVLLVGRIRSVIDDVIQALQAPVSTSRRRTRSVKFRTSSPNPRSTTSCSEAVSASRRGCSRRDVFDTSNSTTVHMNSRPDRRAICRSSGRCCRGAGGRLTQTRSFASGPTGTAASKSDAGKLVNRAKGAPARDRPAERGTDTRRISSGSSSTSSRAMQAARWIRHELLERGLGCQWRVQSGC